MQNPPQYNARFDIFRVRTEREQQNANSQQVHLPLCTERRGGKRGLRDVTQLLGRFYDGENIDTLREHHLAKKFFILVQTEGNDRLAVFERCNVWSSYDAPIHRGSVRRSDIALSEEAHEQDLTHKNPL